MVGYFLHFPAISLGVITHELGHSLMAFFLTKEKVIANIGLGKKKKILFLGRVSFIFTKLPWTQGKTQCRVSDNSKTRRFLILIAGVLFNLIQIILSTVILTFSTLPIRCIMLAWLLSNARVMIGSLYSEGNSRGSDYKKIFRLVAETFHLNKNCKKIL